MNEYNILDCTLRDGGYYNHWDFEPEVVQNYLNAMSESKIDYVELGLRNFKQKGFLGAFAYTTENFLNNLDLPEGPIYGVMIDAKTVLNSKLSIEEVIDKLFVHKKESKIDLVRIAAHFHEVEQSAAIVQALKAKGYLVGYNLMQAAGKSSELISQKAKVVKEWGVLDVLYFADSLGNMNSHEVIRIVKALRQFWDGDLGIHTHNNMAKALDNCMTARQVGVKWLDVTITGMGRGAGNAQTENLLAIVSKEKSKYKASPVYALAIRYFEPMQRISGWGSNLLYFLGAQNNVHPTYIQNLLADRHFGTDEIIAAIDYLSKQDTPSSYSGNVYLASLSFSSKDKPISGTPVLSKVASDREVLILANGPNLHRHIQAVKAYIKNCKPIVIAINSITELSSYIDYYCVSHNNKFLSEKEKYKTLRKSIILPKHRFTDSELQLFNSDCKLIDYGLSIHKELFSSGIENCVVPYDITAAYAFSIAKVMNAKSVSLIGFDGYENNDNRQLEMIETISLMTKNLELSNVVALTPTTYPLIQSSLYAPI